MSYRRYDEPLRIGEFYPECKVYSDGSHYIAIPHTERKTYRRPKPTEEIITVTETPQEAILQNTDESAVTDDVIAPIPLENALPEEVIGQSEETPPRPKESPKTERKITRKELFEELYQNSLSVKKRERRKRIIAAMLPYFKNETETACYVDRNLERKQRNLICRRIRLTRKINMQDFNYFVTFTYNSALHTEESFKKDLKKTLANFPHEKAGNMSAYGNARRRNKGYTFTGCFTYRTAQCRL